LVVEITRIDGDQMYYKLNVTYRYLMRCNLTAKCQKSLLAIRLNRVLQENDENKLTQLRKLRQYW